MRQNLPDKNYFLNKTLPLRPGIRILSHKGTGANAHVFRGHSDELGRDFACKIIPKKNLVGAEEDPPTWRAEVLKANKLRSSAVVKFSDNTEWIDEASGINCIVLISDFVEGETLREFNKTNKGEVTIAFVTCFLKSLLDVFNDMVLQGVEHGDLHAGNVLVADRSSYALFGEQYEFRITDFGVTGATSEPHLKDDFLQLAFMLRDLLQTVDYQSASQKDKFIFNILNDHFLAKHLMEKDTTLDPLARQPRKLFERLKEIDAEFDSAQAGGAAQFLTPFDYPSCEQIGEAHSILKALYSDLFLGLRDIESRYNLVLTGPRGCGKSTVFKSLSLRHRVSVGEASGEQVQYIGIYYRCDDLYFAFPRYRRPNRAEALDLPIHFVTCTLLGEVLNVIETWARANYLDEFSREEPRVAQKIWRTIGLNPPEEPGTNNFRAIVTRLQKERLRAAEKQRFANDPKQTFGCYFGADVLVKACQAVSVSLSFLRERPFYFFIDDYSSPKITKELQENLNRLFMQRTWACFFKLSTESPVSFWRSDVDGKIYVENREFTLLNLGIIYLHAELEEKLAFIEDVFKRRLSAPPSYPVSDLTTLLGANPFFSNNEEARRIRDDRKTEFWGKETLSRLCSGDIHYLIGLVGGMVIAAGGTGGIAREETVPRVPAPTQNRVIREAAGSFLKNLRGIPRHGTQLVDVVTAFGNVAHSYLKFRDSKNEEAHPPHQATRIEPYEPLALSDEAEKIYDELLRYSVFIEDVRGKSRRGKVVPRLYLRRFLVPHFNLTFSTRDSVEINPSDFEEFLLRPAQFEDRFRLKNPQPPEPPGLPFDQHEDG